MKRDEIQLGEPHAVEHPRSEAGMPFGSGYPVVKATPLEVGITYTPGFGSGERKDGVRCRLEEPLRVTSSDPGGWGEQPAGYEFIAPSRNVHRRWGEPDTSHRLHEADDEERRRARALRYAQQDYLRETFARLGLPEAVGGYLRGTPGYALKGGAVVIPRNVLVRWLERIDRSPAGAIEPEDAGAGCPYDTDGDGDCGRCARLPGGCPNRTAERDTRGGPRS